MADRRARTDAFLAAQGWAGAKAEPVTGDASDRRYLRLTGPRGSAILMDAPPEICGPQDAFLTIGAHLRGIGLSAPEAYGHDPHAGLILMEDFGNRLYSREVLVSAKHEADIYRAALDVLSHLRRPPMPGLVPTDAATLAAMIAPVFEHYAAGAGSPVAPTDAQGLVSAFAETLKEAVDPADRVTALRDFHAGNLIWLPGRAGAARVGLLDFQDAFATHPAYDLVSLLQDARRDLAPGLEAALLADYISRNRLDPPTFTAAYRALGAQRHLRILGVFARLAARRGRPGYLRYMARTWAHLRADLAHPALARVAAPLLAVLPEPGPAVIARLEASA